MHLKEPGKTGKCLTSVKRKYFKLIKITSVKVSLDVQGPPKRKKTSIRHTRRLSKFFLNILNGRKNPGLKSHGNFLLLL